MTSSMDVWFSGNKELIWDKFCGYLHLSLPSFMHIQESLLMEQIKLLQGSELGKKLLGNQSINSIEDFRRKVPLTTYDDYEPYLSKKNEAVLPAKPKTWATTTTSGGKIKWLPVSSKAYDILADSILGMYILSTATQNGQFSLQPGSIMFVLLPPPPLFQNLALKEIQSTYGIKIIPPDDERTSKLNFTERILLGYHLALKTNIDVLAGVSGVLNGMNQTFPGFKVAPGELLNPVASFRFLAGFARSILDNGNLLPRHIWKLKSIVAMGMDLAAFSPKLKYLWGINPFEFYINSEFGSYLGSLTWNRKGMTFSPYVGFLEFIPMSDKLEKPGEMSTVLLNQVKEGQIYEVVFTNLNGGPFVRYRPGDAIQFIAKEDEETGIKLPQFVVKGRTDKLIDIGSFTRIDEKTLWKLVETSGIKYNDWMARKEFEAGEPILSLYLECSSDLDQNALSSLFHEKLKNIDPSYAHLEEMSYLKPLRIKSLPSGTLAYWEKEMLKAGKDFAWVKDQKMQSSDSVIEDILRLAKDKS